MTNIPEEPDDSMVDQERIDAQENRFEIEEISDEEDENWYPMQPVNTGYVDPFDNAPAPVRNQRRNRRSRRTTGNLQQVVQEARQNGPAAAANAVNPPIRQRPGRRPRPPAPDEMRCIAIKKNGQRCPWKKTAGRNLCNTHYAASLNAGVTDQITRIRTSVKTTNYVNQLKKKQEQLADEFKKVAAVESTTRELETLVRRNTSNWNGLNEREARWQTQMQNIVGMLPGIPANPGPANNGPPVNQ